jgi:hypothetical protein
MTFSVDTEVFGERKTVLLMEDGDNVEVTDENKKEYAEYVHPDPPLDSSLRKEMSTDANSPVAIALRNQGTKFDYLQFPLPCGSEFYCFTPG